MAYPTRLYPYCTGAGACTAVSHAVLGRQDVLPGFARSPLRILWHALRAFLSRHLGRFATVPIGVILGLCRDDGKATGNYYCILELYWEYIFCRILIRQGTDFSRGLRVDCHSCSALSCSGRTGRRTCSPSGHELCELWTEVRFWGTYRGMYRGFLGGTFKEYIISSVQTSYEL